MTKETLSDFVGVAMIAVTMGVVLWLPAILNA